MRARGRVRARGRAREGGRVKEGGGLALKMLRMCSMKSEGKGRPISVGNIRSSSSKFCTCAARRGAVRCGQWCGQWCVRVQCSGRWCGGHPCQ